MGKKFWRERREGLIFLQHAHRRFHHHSLDYYCNSPRLDPSRVIANVPFFNSMQFA
jgi:hypothetical protein